MTQAMTEKGSIDVDAVSGATITSTAVKKAAQKTLEEAGVDPEQFGGMGIPAGRSADPA